MLKALRQSESLFSRYYLNEEFNDVMFTFELRDDIIIGQPFRYLVFLTQQNYTHQDYQTNFLTKLCHFIYFLSRNICFVLLRILLCNDHDK